MQYLPLFFDLKGRDVLLVGGGDIALRKARLLSRAGAQLSVVALEILPELHELLDQHQGLAITGPYHAALLAGKTLVLAATDDEALNERVHHDAIAANVPVNVVDNPALCTFIFPAIVDRSPIVIGISSGGQSPVLARILRSKLESQIPVSFSRLGQLVGRLRDQVKARFGSVNERRVFWEKVLNGQVAERVFAGRDAEAEALLLEQIAAGNADNHTGEVYLVGAGPGDPELLTFKALRLMQQADVVLYDRLVSDEVLELCRRDADLIYVGKKRDNHAVPQQDINQLLIDHARAGRRVVRLKGGDPFIFGRGGEELEQLKAAGIPFQVVPGITAASACSTYGGIPLTHRNYAQSVKFVTGQLKNRTSDLNFAELVQPNQTIVFYMGLHTLELLVQGLMEQGKPADTLIAIVSQGTSAQQRVLTGQLQTIVAQQAEAQLEAPAIIIVGEVVALQSQLSWFGASAETE
ncbi:siroheme synthase CysG [Nitrincola iocasae]|uniref:Siroheme synthase n=1 Tax=Nitrincola iocasae TaxID=2614693 RepID=A0A5J6LE10_9GAMM|nr:siroheme synthase CysG [Nitrincola iocasae]QEW06919.1 uroporphyrinogen-III C-methyltransferase [Nitrincola iocasae]